MRPGTALLRCAACALAALVTSPARGQAPPTLHIQIDSVRRDLVVEIGPTDLPADGMHHQLPALHTTLPFDGWLHGYSVEVVDAAGRPVPKRMVHHVNIITPQQRELFSPIMLRIGAVGQETAPVVLPRLMGYRVRRGQTVIFTAMLHNPSRESYQGVRIRVHFPFTLAGALLKPMAVMPFYMDVMPPASLHSYDLPPGRSSKSWEARPAIAARILGIGGHLHPYGTALRLVDVTAGKTLWEGRPSFDRNGEVVGMTMSRFIWRLGLPVRPDHVYRIVAEYDNTSGETIPGGAMGALGGVVVAEDELRWPAVDRESPVLRMDWHLVHTGNQDGGHMHMHGSMPGMQMPAAESVHAHGAGEREAMRQAPHAHLHANGAQR
jgi:hypothetical protein